MEQQLDIAATLTNSAIFPGVPEFAVRERLSGVAENLLSGFDRCRSKSAQGLPTNQPVAAKQGYEETKGIVRRGDAEKVGEPNGRCHDGSFMSKNSTGGDTPPGDRDRQAGENGDAESGRPSMFNQHGSASTPPVALFLMDLSRIDSDLIELCLQGDVKHGIRLVDTLANAQIVLIDCDRPGAVDGVRQATQVLRKGVVGFAQKPRERRASFPDIIILGKPLKVGDLMQALALVRAVGVKASSLAVRKTLPTSATKMADPGLRVAHQENDPPSTFGDSIPGEDIDFCGAQGDISRTRPGQLPGKLFFDPEHYLLGHLLRAAQECKVSGEPCAVIGLPRMIRVQSVPEPICLTSFSTNRLRSASMIELPPGAARVTADPGPWKDTRQATVSTLEEMLWNVAVWAARGRLPKGADPYKAVGLRVRPNFPQCCPPLHGQRIAALWAEKVASPVDIAAELGIPQRYVFAFFSAARFAGFFERRVDPLAEKAPAANSALAMIAGGSATIARIVKKLIRPR